MLTNTVIKVTFDDLRAQQIIDNYWTRSEQNIVICQWRADKLFAEAEG